MQPMLSNNLTNQSTCSLSEKGSYFNLFDTLYINLYIEGNIIYLWYKYYKLLLGRDEGCSQGKEWRWVEAVEIH